jgi:RHS repeat-associated protein
LTCVEQHGDAATGTGCSASLSSDASSPWRVRRFTYDSLSRLLSSSNPEANTALTGIPPAPTRLNTTYTYDANGNLKTRTAPAPNQTGSATVTTTYGYDALNRLTIKSFSDGTNHGAAFEYIYDLANYTSSSASIPISNPVGRLIHVSNDVNAASTFSYDPMGRVIQQTSCLPSNCNDAANPVTTHYDLAGNLSSLTYPDGETVAYTPDAVGRMLSAIDTANGINYITSANYGPDGSLTGFVSGNTGGFAGITNSFSYNKRLQPIFMSAATPTQTVFSIGYDFHLGNGDNGNVYQLTNNKDHTRDQSFTYDQLNRLVSAQNAGTDCSATLPDTNSKFWGNSYGYDAWGNLLTKNVTKCGAEFLSVVAQANNQLGGYGYDAAGNLTSAQTPTGQATSSFDAENRLTTASLGGATTTYTYDADGQRVRKDVAGAASTEYMYFNGEVIAEKNATSGAWTNYMFFAGNRVARRDSSNAVSYYFSDHLKTTDIVTDALGNIKSESDFYPWGGELQFTANDSNHYKFTGKERDSETGLDYFGARYYSQALGRFITPDWSATPVPVPYADLTDPQTLCQYCYVRDLPTTRYDADGHLEEEDGKKSNPTPGSYANITMCTGYCEEHGNSVDLLNAAVDHVLSHPAVQGYIDFFAAGAGGEIGAAIDRSIGAEAGAAAKAEAAARATEGTTVPKEIPAGPSAKPDAAQQRKINEMGDTHGCSTCPAKTPGTKSGNWVGDHQPPTSVNPPGNPQTYRPQCLGCSLRQGGQLRAAQAKAAAAARRAAKAAAKKRHEHPTN